MPSNRIALSTVAIAAAAILGGGTSWALTGPDASHPAPVADSTTAARTTLPGLAAATGDPTLPGLKSAAPHPGAVVQLSGPFDDRLTLSRLTLSSGTVTATLRVTSDVSDLLELQVLAGFYDRHGAFLGAGRFTHHQGEVGHAHTGPPNEVEHIRITAPPKIRGRVASAAVGVPVLVNE